MSDVAKKNLPVGQTKESKTSKVGDEASETGRTQHSAPRSAPPPSISKDAGKASTAAGEEQDEDYQSGHYTHEGESLNDIPEESANGLKSVDPEPLSNGHTEDHEQQNGEEGATENGVDESVEEGAEEELEKAKDAEVPEESYGGSKASLTESAKKAFDLASEGKSTEQARESLLQTAQGDEQTIAPQDSVTSHNVPTGQSQTEEAQTEAKTETEHPQGTEVQTEGEQFQTEEQPATEVQEGATEVQEGATELQEGATETQYEGEAPAETQEQAPTELENQEGTFADSEEAPLDFSILKDGTINKGGNVINPEGKLVGRVIEGTVADLVGKRVDENGQIWDDRGRQVGKAEPLSDKEREDFAKESKPFESFLDNTIDGDGMVISGGEPVGRVIEGDIKQLRGKSCDAEGEILDKAGNVIGRAERWEAEPEVEEEPEPEAETDNSALAGGIVTKKGFVTVNGKAVGRVVEGVLSNLINKRVDENGQIWSDGGKVIGRAEVIPDNEREDLEKDNGPFSSFPDAVVGSDGWVLNGEGGDVIGKVVEGDAKALRNNTVEADGQIVDKVGRELGRAERWEPEAEPEAVATDYSSLAGKRVNKAGWLVDSSGNIFGRVVEGDVKSLIGRMANKEGQILSESGDVIGRAELVSEGEREGMKEGPFAELSGLTVAKDGTVVTPSGDIVGRLISGDAKALTGRSVDEDGDVLDRNGNQIGKAERWQPEEKEKTKNPLTGRKVNRQGEVVDADGNIIGKLTSGNLQVCSGKEIDEDGDVVDGKGTVIGHVSLLDDIPKEEEPVVEESEEEKQREQDKKLAAQLSVCLEQCLERIRPLCKMITEKLDEAENRRKNDEEVDEDRLVSETKPLIEEASRILNEAHGMIKGMDPDGRLSQGAKARSATREASPEEYHLADVLKELTTSVQETIDRAKKRLERFPKAKKELNPALALLREPLFQIIGAVGLLLAGVLNLLSRLLAGLGLGGLLDGILGTLGLNRLLDTIGIGSLTGGDKKSKGGGGLLGGILGGGK